MKKNNTTLKISRRQALGSVMSSGVVLGAAACSKNDLTYKKRLNYHHLKHRLYRKIYWSIVSEPIKLCTRQVLMLSYAAAQITYIT